MDYSYQRHFKFEIRSKQEIVLAYNNICFSRYWRYYLLSIKKMKLITWNLNMAFRNKAEFILTEEPDILIVPESESIEKLKFKKDVKQPNDSFLYGDNSNKGI